MPLLEVYCFDLVNVSLALWLNFIIHDCKKRNVLHEKKIVSYKTKRKWGVRNKMWFKKTMDNNWALRKKMG